MDDDDIAAVGQTTTWSALSQHIVRAEAVLIDNDDEFSNDDVVALAQTTTWSAPTRSLSSPRVVPTPPAPEIDLAPITIDEQVSLISLSSPKQNRLLASIVACLLPNDGDNVAFSISFFAEFVDLLSLKSFEFEPLIRTTIDPAPFVDDLDVVDELDRGRLLVNVLLFATSTFKAYDARVRVLLVRMSLLFGIKWAWMVREEAALVTAIRSNTLVSDPAITERRSSRVRRWVQVGAAVVVSSSLLVVTAGIAAPALGAGIVALGAGTGVGAFIGSVTGTALISGLFGATAGGLAGYKMNRRTRDIREFEFVALFGTMPPEQQQSLLVTICVAGMLDDNTGYEEVWAAMRNEAFPSERYALQWETEVLRDLGKGIKNFTRYQVGSVLFQEGLKQTLLMGVMNALAWPTTLLSASYIIDNPWSTAVSRADKAGFILADALLQRPHGHRPVNLIGYSVGARVIYKALLALADVGVDGQGIVQDAFLLGCPESASVDQWRRMKSVVAGRLVNGYSKTDWVLKFIFRAAAPTLTVCGLSPVALDSVENIDISSVIEGHQTYLLQLPEILDSIQVTV